MMEAFMWLLVGLIVYFAPTWLTAKGRRLSTFVINAPLGWTGIGYVVALFMAARSREKR